MFGLNLAKENNHQRWIWAAWSGLVLALVFSIVLVFWASAGLNKSAENRQQRSETLGQISRQIEIDIVAMRSSLGLTQIEMISWHGFALFRKEFDRFRVLVEQSQNASALAVPTDGFAFENLMSSQREFLATYRDLVHLPDRDLARFVPKMEADLDRMVLDRRALLMQATQEMLALAETENDSLSTRFLESGLWSTVLMLVMLSLIAAATGAGIWVQRRLYQANRSVRNMQSIIDSSRDAVIVMDQEVNIREVGGAAEATFGFDKDDIRGRNAMELFATELPHTEMIRRARELFDERPEWMKEGRRLELNGKRADGTTFPIEAGFGFVEDDDGSQMVIASIVDCSDQAERELNLMQARNEALQAERAKSRFLSSISHEMRTPLNGLLASLDLMRETTEMNDRQAELATIIERCGDDALEQVENVLELTRLDTLANTAVNVAPFSPSSVLREIVEAATSKAQSSENRLRFETTAPYNLYVEGSAILFRQIMHNFISNAIKFTTKGDILVSLEVSDNTLDSMMGFRASVSDTGIGIHPDDVDRIFRSFETIRDSYSHFSSGSGLGLSIAKHSADLMGARIDVHSEPGKGSKFTLDAAWPSTGFENTDPSAGVVFTPQDHTEASKGMDVLVVEDNEINRRMLVDMLQSRGHRVTQAKDGIEGVSRGREHEFDLILMDISMPKLDGVGATRMLRQFGKSKRSPIVAVTAHSQPEHLKEFTDAGMDRVLTKPLRLHTLDQLFDDMGRTNTFEAPVPPRTEPVAKENTAMAKELIEMEVFEALIDMLGGDSVVGYLDQFQNDADTMLPIFNSAIREGDFELARSEAHRCAGGAAVIGAGRVHKILQDMTHSADDQQGDKCLSLAETLPPIVIDSLNFMRDYAASTDS